MRTLGALLALALMPACNTATPTTTPADGTTGAATSTPTPFDALNLGFEQADTPEGWKVARSKYPVSVDTSAAFEGSASLRLVHDGVHKSGTVKLELPLSAVAGKKLTAKAQVKTEGVDYGAVTLRLVASRGDDDLARRETPMPERARGTADWTELSVQVEVPTEAETVWLSLDHGGSGTAWFDAIELSVDDLDAPPPPAFFTGRVLDSAGKPAPKTLVAAFSQMGEHSLTETDAEGRFSMEVGPGTYQLGVGGPAGVGTATYIPLQPGDNEPVEVTLALGTQSIKGQVDDQDGRGHGGALAVVATDDDHIYPTRTADDGSWSLLIPPAKEYMAVVQAANGQRVMTMVEDPNALIESTLNREGVAPTAAVEWIRDHHVPLTTVEPGHGLEDMAKLDPMFAKATVVGLGETTHGTREFFQMKHRMLEYLVERHGFTVFGIEANRTECRAIDRYVQTGEGDPKAALRGIYFWTWNTTEVLDLIEWMRQYNASHDEKLHFVGFDAQTPDVAARNVAQFLGTVDPDAPEREAVALFGRPWNNERFDALSKEEQTKTLAALDRLAERFASERAAWTKATSADAFADASEDLTVVRQVLKIRQAPGMDSFSARDRGMADNVLHIEERYGKGTKTVLWAHNGHIARSWTQTDVMGGYIGEALGKRYVSVGFAFDRGGFQAISMDGDEFIGLREHVVGSAAPGEIESALREGGPELFALSLRALPKKGDAAQWLRSPLSMRQIGAAFSADDMTARVVERIPERFDVLLFVEQTTRARPVPRED